jgi:predicted nucleotidyltransferase
LRSQQQGVVLAALLGAPDQEVSISDLGRLTGTPYASVHREVERAIAAGLVRERRVGNVRLVQADSDSPYFDGLSSVLVRAFGPPAVLAEALADVPGIESAYLFGSWAARFSGEERTRPVQDIDLLVLGEPDRTRLFEAIASASERLGREVQVTIRPAGWVEDGDGTFHATVTARPMVPIEIDRPQ